MATRNTNTNSLKKGKQQHKQPWGKGEHHWASIPHLRCLVLLCINTCYYCKIYVYTFWNEIKKITIVSYHAWKAVSKKSKVLSSASVGNNCVVIIDFNNLLHWLSQASLQFGFGRLYYERQFVSLLLVLLTVYIYNVFIPFQELSIFSYFSWYL